MRHFERYDKGGFRTKVILNRETGRHVRLSYRDADFHLKASDVDNADAYDPRKRPWYQKAIAENRIVWTDPYIFYTSQKPGITIAGPFFDSEGMLRGVVGVDIEIDQLSTFIGNLKIGKHGKAFMINRNADVVAFGEIDKLKVVDQSGNGSFRLVKIQELDDLFSRKAFAAAKIETDAAGMLVMDGSRFSRFENDGQDYLAMFTPFSNAQWPWIIGVYLPEADYLGAINANRRLNIWVTIAISFFAAVIGFLLARGVIRPIALLEATSRKMKLGQTVPLPPIRSVYSEIQETANAFGEMKTAVERSHRKYLGIFNNIQDVYWESSLNGTMIEISPSIEKVSGYKRNELIGKTTLKFYSEPEHRHDMVAILKDKGRIYDHEVVFKDKDGRLMYCSLNSILLRTRSGKPYRIIGSLRNISDRKMAEAELLKYKEQLEALVRARTMELQKANDGLLAQIEQRQAMEKQLRISEEKYRTILDTIEEAYFETDYRGRLTFVNDAAGRIMGYSAQELLGMHFRHYATHQATREVIRAFVKMVQSGDPVRVITYPVTTKNGENKILDLSAALIHENTGKITGFRGLARDVTAKFIAQREKEKLQGQLNYAQRMEAVGTLAGGIAHDFNNLLMGVMGNVSLLETKIGRDSPLSSYLQAIEHCVESGASLTRQLLGYARGGKYRVTSVDLNEAVKRTTDMFGRTKKEVRILTHYADKAQLVNADQGQIDQVLLNLYVNAWQAMTDNMTLRVSTDCVVLDAAFTTPFSAKPGSYAAIKVQDQGKGIAPEIMKRIFDPFFTTRKMGRGTGLGLASAFGIIKNHGGIIDVQSQVGKGSTFTIYLPLADCPSQEEGQRASSEAAAEAGSGRLLVVDDEAFVLKALCAILQDLGYQVVTAGSGQEAIDRFTIEKDRIDGVLLDMIMPDMNGRQVLGELKAIRPDVKVILSSGYSLDGLEEQQENAMGDGFIQKPYTIDELSTILARVFHR